MWKRLLNWLDERTSYRHLLTPIVRRVLPAGPRWSLTSASVLLWLFIIEIATGLFLMTTYSPSTMTAWASVHYIEQSPFGSFLRGIHFIAAQAIIILIIVHVVRVLISAAFRAPRELIWITGLLLLPLMIVWAITGNPLSNSLKGVAQIEVEGNILGSTPLVGPVLQRILIGGDEVGHLTLTHLYFLHVGFMPLVVTLLLGVHVWQVYRHGLTPQKGNSDGSSARPYFPYQTVRNMTVLTAVLGILAYYALRHGAPLDVPADSTLSLVPRPEWYFRSLFELRRYFTGDWEFVATLIIPGTAMAILLAIPFIDRWFQPRTSFVLRSLLVLLGLGGAGGLTLVSFMRDWNDQEYQHSLVEFEEHSARAREIADHRHIPPEGAIALLRDDAKTQGPLLFKLHCASCHPYVDAQGVGIPAPSPSAPNLYGFGTASWIGGMLDPERIKSEHVFGKTKFVDGEMQSSIVEKFDGAKSEEDRKALREQLAKVARALSAEAQLNSQAPADAQDQALIAAGKELLTGDLSCTDCHKFHDVGELGSGPDLTGYASREWLEGMIANPQHERFYPDDRNDRMPAFCSDPQHPRANLITPTELKLLVDWMRGEWFEAPASPADSSPAKGVALR